MKDPRESLDPVLVRNDAKDRAERTLAQGLIIDLLVALGLALTSFLTDLGDSEIFSRAAWVGFAGLLTKSLLQAAASWFMRLRVTPKIDRSEIPVE